MTALAFRTTGAWGAGQGYNLTAAQVDGNFYELAERIAAVIADIPAPLNISNITVIGTQMRIYLEDATVFGPFTLPQATFRPSIVATVSATTHAPVLSDSNGYKRCTNAAGCAVTLPDNADVAFAIDTEITYRQCAAGAVSFDQPTDSAVTINGLEGFLQQTGVIGAVVTVKKVGTDTWDLIGLVVEDVTA